MTPSQYLKSVGQDYKYLPAGVCDAELSRAEKSIAGIEPLVIPNYIPEKYHARIQTAWIAMVYRTLFDKAAGEYGLMRRHNMLKKEFTK